MLLRSGELFEQGDRTTAFVVESGALIVEIITPAGTELFLRKLQPGEAVVNLAAISSPAFEICCRAEGLTRLVERPGGEADDAVALQAVQQVLAAAVRMVHEIACLQTSHRLYCELLRMESANRQGHAARLPTQTALAMRLCTTRETVSRELSFLRRAGVICTGSHLRVLNVGFLLSKLAIALQLPCESDVWTSIGVSQHG